MFAEELGGNPTRRRQEEAKARRRKLKQQQEQKEKTEARAREQQQAATTASAASSDAVASPSPVTNNHASAVAQTSTSGMALDIPPPAKPNSAVANAMQQRQQRQAAQQLLQASIKIQSFYRAHSSNSNLLKEQSALLGQRLQDLSTLTAMLKQQKQHTNTNIPMEYVPPPATATALVQQLLFLTRSLPYQSNNPQTHRIVKLRHNMQDARQVQRVLDLVVLPGVHSMDENGNPFLVWLQTKLGQSRTEALLRLVLVTTTSPNVEETVQTTCWQLVKALTGTSDRPVPASIVVFGTNRLLAALPPSPHRSPPSPTTLKSQPKPIAQSRSSLDLMALLRFHLLYATGGAEPIPKAAETSREACIPVRDRIQANAIFRVTLQAIQTMTDSTMVRHLQLRLVSEILTVPLLTWKATDSSMNQLLTIDSCKGLYLVRLLRHFTHHYGALISAGDIGLTLCHDTSMATCPATPTQCLMANLLQIGKLSPQLNGNQLSRLDFAAATTFYTFLATLVDVVPLATLNSSRESVVEWISDGKGHHSPVVLSPMVMEQCRYLVVDSLVRKLFHCAIDETSLKTETILQTKNDKDMKQEKALQQAGASATSLAAKEARADRSKVFWNSSAWARKLTKGVSKMFDNKDDAKSSGGGEIKSTAANKLVDASSMSRKLAKGEASDEAAVKGSTRVAYTPDLFIALCKLYGMVLARWGGCGGEDIVRRSGLLYKKDTSGAKQVIATTKPDLCTQSLLNNLIFSTSTIKAAWGLIQSDPKIVADVYSIIDSAKAKVPVRARNIRPVYETTKSKEAVSSDGAAVLFVFTTALSHVLIVTDDTEMHEMQKPLPLHQLRRCIQTLKQLLYRACCLDDSSLSMKEDATTKSSSFTSSYFGYALINATARTMRDLYDRSSRRPLSIPKLWLIDDLLEKEIRCCKTSSDYVNLLSSPVLRVCPFLVSFKRRLKLFERIVSTDRIAIQGENSQNPFNSNPLKPGIPVRITRGRILEDGLATMNNLGRNMRQRLAVQYFNAAGMRESGIDAGGLFKEFWTDLCAIAFDPNYALFRVTSENCMYPNPSSVAAHGVDHIMLFEFLGRILGKALYEGITVHPQFAHFFLSHLRGDYNYLNMLPDLSTMDSQLYNNIMFLKTYDGDAEDLCLTFTVANDDFGGKHETQLMPNGGNVEVTNVNKQRYIGLVAKYYVVDRIKEQSEAFTRGLREVIDKVWLKIFNEPELQVLISGPSDGGIDVEDMRSNCRYAGGFTGIDRTVNRFWGVVASLESKQQADLLRFVTSCERPPPLGFACLNPPFTIQRVGILRDGDKLPTSSTCFNVLKLPTYSSEKVMKERLLYAIQSGAGFELS